MRYTISLSLSVRLEFVKYIISLFEINTGNQRRYSKQLKWNLCKLTRLFHSFWLA